MLTEDTEAQKKSQVTRQKIILAAAKVFAEKGYSEAKLDDIAGELGAKAGSLYYHFESRDDITRAVLQKCMGMLDEQVDAALSGLPANSPFENVLKIGVGAHLSAILSDKPYMAAYNRIINEVQEHLRLEFQEVPEKYAKRWHELIVHAQENGELRRDIDPSLFQVFLLDAVNWSRFWFQSTGPKSVGELRDQIVELFLWGALELE